MKTEYNDQVKELNGEFKLKVADDEEITFYLKGE